MVGIASFESFRPVPDVIDLTPALVLVTPRLSFHRPRRRIIQNGERPSQYLLKWNSDRTVAGTLVGWNGYLGSLADDSLRLYAAWNGGVMGCAGCRADGGGRDEKGGNHALHGVGLDDGL